MRLNARITANSGILKKPEGDVHPEDVTRQDDPAGPRCDQEFDESLDSFRPGTFWNTYDESNSKLLTF